MTLREVLEFALIGKTIRIVNRSYNEPKFIVKMVRLTSKGNVELWGEVCEKIISDKYIWWPGMVVDRLISQTTVFECFDTVQPEVSNDGITTD